jgi:hypothetical protein
VGLLSELLSYRLGEDPALRVEQNQRAGRRRTKHAFYGGENGFGLHYHTATPAIGDIVADVVAVGGPIANVMQPYFNQLVFTGALQDTGIQVGGEDIWKQGKYVE